MAEPPKLPPGAIEFKSLRFPTDRTSLTIAEVAERLALSEQHVHDLIDEGQLQATNAGGGQRNHWRIPVEAYNVFLDERHSFNVLNVGKKNFPSGAVPRGSKRSRAKGHGRAA